MRSRTLLALLVIVGLVVAPLLTLPVLAADAPAPGVLKDSLPEFKRMLLSQLERRYVWQARFMGREYRSSDHFTLLKFELRAYPFLAPPLLAFMVSRCTSIEELRPGGMGGGTAFPDFETDAEVAHLRTGAQPPCSAPRQSSLSEGRLRQAT